MQGRQGVPWGRSQATTRATRRFIGEPHRPHAEMGGCGCRVVASALCVRARLGKVLPEDGRCQSKRSQVPLLRKGEGGMTEENCGNCRFWVRDPSTPDNNFGECHRGRPTVSNQIRRWPAAHEPEWCGEWEGKPVCGNEHSHLPGEPCTSEPGHGGLHHNSSASWPIE